MEVGPAEEEGSGTAVDTSRSLNELDRVEHLFRVQRAVGSPSNSPELLDHDGVELSKAEVLRRIEVLAAALLQQTASRSHSSTVGPPFISSPPATSEACSPLQTGSLGSTCREMKPHIAICTHPSFNSSCGHTHCARIATQVHAQVPSTAGTVALDLGSGAKEFVPAAESAVSKLTAESLSTASDVLGWRPMDSQAFERYVLVLALAHRAVRTNTVRTIRDVFYEYKVRSLPNLSLRTPERQALAALFDPAPCTPAQWRPFAEQSQVERAVAMLSATLRVSRAWLNFEASPKGMVAGCLSILDPDAQIHVSQIRRRSGPSTSMVSHSPVACHQSDCRAGPQLIPPIRPVTEMHADEAQFVLVIEKEAVFSGLINAGFLQRCFALPLITPHSRTFCASFLSYHIYAPCLEHGPSCPSTSIGELH